MIDIIPARTLPAIKPLLTFLADDFWKPVIETGLPVEEIAMIDEGTAEYRNDPSTFVTLDSIE
jgi:hypothetical protein